MAFACRNILDDDALLSLALNKLNGRHRDLNLQRLSTRTVGTWGAYRRRVRVLSE